MKLHEEAEDRNERMKRQLAHSKLQQQVDEQAEQIKELKAVVLRLNKTVQALIRKLGP